jgi:hypothetical protein
MANACCCFFFCHSSLRGATRLSSTKLLLHQLRAGQARCSKHQLRAGHEAAGHEASTSCWTRSINFVLDTKLLDTKHQLRAGHEAAWSNALVQREVDAAATSCWTGALLRVSWSDKTKNSSMHWPCTIRAEKNPKKLWREHLLTHGILPRGTGQVGLLRPLVVLVV